MTEDFYDLLEVSEDASQDDIKRAFREQVRVYHPDLNDDDRAQAQFTALKKAYDILGDPVERRAYDRLGHEDYVAKRTKGLPSPDVWKTSTDEADGDESADDDRASATASTAAGRTGAGGASTGGTGADREKSSARSSASTASTSTATGGYADSTGTSGDESGASANAGSGTASGSGVGGARASAAGTTGPTGPGAAASGTSTGTATGHRSSDTASHSRPGPLTDNAIVRWWRAQNFGVPLLWASALLYLGGLVQFGLWNRPELASLAAELRGVGADPERLWATLSTGRHGVDTVTGFVTAVEPVAPPLPDQQWYGALAGIVACSLLLVLGARVAWRRHTWGPISIDETIVVALALGGTTALLGGPLLAGVALLPLLFGVVVYQTHKRPGWSPSYLYVLAVCAPAIGLAAAFLGYESLPGDLVAFLVLPLLGGFGLPIRVWIRKRFGK